MTRSELIEHIAKRQNQFDDIKIEQIVRLILDQMAQSLIKNQRIEIRGFGSFSLHKRDPRKARNPKTGESVVTEPKHAIHFKPGKSMRERVDQSKNIYPIQEDKDDDHDD
ncbi:Integration host factor subunit beta [Piscirickettsia salmonis]|uniref:Transcriptional regulator n=1 Tax=Piscirickettsia salmonis TaxID=1238 RepID=A0A1L6TET2_PISSA|nr:integration host factor subunit beta [Piscirickettsia salmonis]AKP72598.1 integration host factor subunit beta [Piscirickettsia salmonis LF-89 = ATCC VR-1361]ALB23918.1 transcriptional regulator [Piscirickettsia salmonis]ALY03747.1 integration host factor subunit beta [Piscirickettsia salmonis]AMA43309.1 integration host factor subunit beta [Piscirickettsia salmonis]AOS35779.1 integration host factor subunit beta [Piscirickettsia salmonis]